MPSAILPNLEALGNARLVLVWREPYVTEALNFKDADIVPAGIYRGYRLAVDPGLGDRTVLMVSDPDPDLQDHVAVYRTTDNHALTIRITGGDQVLDLTSETGATIVICLFATYSVGANTHAEIRAYTLAEYNALSSAAKAELVIMGQVVVPGGAGAIAASAITPNRRSAAWKATASEADRWTPILKNPGFEEGPVGDLPDSGNAVIDPIPGWEHTATGGVSFTITNADSATTKGRRSIGFVDSIGGGVVVDPANVYQEFMVPVYPGQRILITFKYKILVSAIAGTLGVTLFCSNEETTGPTTSFIASDTVDLTAAPGGWKTFEQTIEIPATGVGVIWGMAIGNPWNSLSPSGSPWHYNTGGGTTVVRFDDVQLYVESDIGSMRGLSAIDRSRYGRFLETSGLLFRDRQGTNPFDYADPSVAIGTLAWDTVATFNSKPVLRLLARSTIASAAPHFASGGSVVAGDKHTNVTTGRFVSVGTTANGYAAVLDAEKGPDYGTAVTWHLYQHGFNGMASVVNATWSGTQWNFIDGTKTAFRWDLGNFGPSGAPGFPQVRLLSRTSAGPWDDTESGTGWEHTIVDFGLDERDLTDFGKGTGLVRGKLIHRDNTYSSSVSIDADFDVHFLDSSGGPFTLTLPDPSDFGVAHRILRIKDIKGTLAANPVTIARFGAEKIEGLAASFVMDGDWQVLDFYSDGVDWWFQN